MLPLFGTLSRILNDMWNFYKNLDFYNFIIIFIFSNIYKF